MAGTRSGASRNMEDEKEQAGRADDEAPQPRSPFPRYERIAEGLTGGRTGPPEPPEEEIPRTENWGELWSRAARRAPRR